MSATSVEPNAGAYDMRSLSHERRMLSVYRSKVADGDASNAQSLANACWRASMFEWALYREEDTVRRLWAEGARTLADGLARARSLHADGARPARLARGRAPRRARLPHFARALPPRGRLLASRARS